MDQLEAIRNYLRIAARRGTHQRSEPEALAMPFVTISREAGAGGHLLAERLLEAFSARAGDPMFEDWAVFDRALCERVAGDPALDVSLRGLLDESSLNTVEDMVSMLFGRSPQRDVNEKVVETVRELALVGKAIIVGRGGATATRDLPMGLHLRLIAPFDLRVEREARGHSAEPADVEKQIRERDRNRAAFARRLSKHDIGDPLLYDAVWNTERVPVELIVESVVRWVEMHRPGAR